MRAGPAIALFVLYAIIVGAVLYAINALFSYPGISPGG
jgi:hypothetical protein